MSSTEFTGHVSAMRADNEFLGAEDLIGRGDVPFQIAKCNRCLNRKACGKTVPEMYTLNLLYGGKPAKKEFWIKATNRQQITRLYGPNVGEWKGKWIWLYVIECKSPQGGMTFGIRIHDRKDAPETKPSTQTSPDSVSENTGHGPLARSLSRRIGNINSSAEAEQMRTEIAESIGDGLSKEEADALFAQLDREMGQGDK